MATLSQIAAVIEGSSNLIGTGLKFFLQLSSYMGQKLVNEIVHVFHYMNLHYQSSVVLFGVIREDFLVFYNDVGEKSSLLASIIITGISRFADGVTEISSIGIQFITKTINFTCEAGNALISVLLCVTSFVKTSIILVRESILLVGSSIWFAVTRTLTAILSCFTWIFVQLRNFFQDIPLFFLGIKNAIFNLPYTSFLGLLIGLVLLYTTVKNYRTVLFVILQILRKFYSFLSCLCYNFWNSHFGRRHHDLKENEYKLCIICQERPKDAIILPCKHICMCLKCGLHIAKIHRVCPICRSEIETTMKVYI